MRDANKILKSSRVKQHQEIEAINNSIESSVRNTIQLSNDIVDHFDRTVFESSRAIKISVAAAHVNINVLTSQNLQELKKRLISASDITFMVARQSWLDEIKRVSFNLTHHRLQLPRDSHRLSLSDVSLPKTFAHRVLGGIDFDAAIKKQFQIETRIGSELRKSAARIAQSSECAAKSMQVALQFKRLTAFVPSRTTCENLTTGIFPKTLRELDERVETLLETKVPCFAEIEHETSGCIAHLEQVCPDLVPLLLGAREALDGNNTDRARHVLCSLRTLWEQLLRLLAPDKRVIGWKSEMDNQRQQFCELKPTRKDKILYICRELNHGPLVKVLEHDTLAIIELLGVCHRIHALNIKLTDAQLRVIVLKNELWLKYILQISNQTQVNQRQMERTISIANESLRNA